MESPTIEWSSVSPVERASEPRAAERGVHGHLDELGVLIQGETPRGWYVRGWATLTDTPSVHTDLEIELRGAGVSYRSPVEREEREDVALVLGRREARWSGYHTALPAAELSEGKYALALRVRAPNIDVAVPLGATLCVHDGKVSEPALTQQPLVHVVHVPKTAGTSFRQLLSRHYQHSLSLFYRDAVVIQPQTRCVQGHNCASALMHSMPNVQLAMWFRHPVERVVSEYFHWLRNPHIYPRIGWDLVGFAKRVDMQNVQRRMLSSLPLSRLQYIGITEQPRASVELFCKTFDVSPIELPAENTNPAKEVGAPYDLLPDIRQEIAALNAEDLELYERAKQRFGELCREHGVAV